MKLTEHFDLNEFTRSATADRLLIDNSLNPSDPTGLAIIANLRNLCQKVLEPLRQHFGEPVIISSGYRCPELNKAVGGVANSQHQTGEAADTSSHFPHREVPQLSTISPQLYETGLTGSNPTQISTNSSLSTIPKAVTGFTSRAERTARPTGIRCSMR